MSSRIVIPVEAIPAGSTLHTYADGTVWVSNPGGAQWVRLRELAEQHEAGPESIGPKDTARLVNGLFGFDADWPTDPEDPS